MRSQRYVKRYDFVIIHHLQVANFHQILDGLFYIHTGLQLYYGDLNCDNVWLKRDGAVKLINVNDVMLNDVKISENTERKDICTMGFLMKELMEPKISLQNPDSIVLQYPENWPNDWGIRTFLKATQSSTLNELKKVQIFLPRLARLILNQQADFLSGEPIYRCLIPRVCMTEASVRRE